MLFHCQQKQRIFYITDVIEINSCNPRDIPEGRKAKLVAEDILSPSLEIVNTPGWGPMRSEVTVSNSTVHGEGWTYASSTLFPPDPSLVLSPGATLTSSSTIPLPCVSNYSQTSDQWLRETSNKLYSSAQAKKHQRENGSLQQA